MTQQSVVAVVVAQWAEGAVYRAIYSVAYCRPGVVPGGASWASTQREA